MVCHNINCESYKYPHHDSSGVSTPPCGSSDLQHEWESERWNRTTLERERLKVGSSIRSPDSNDLNEKDVNVKSCIHAIFAETLATTHSEQQTSCLLEVLR